MTDNDVQGDQMGYNTIHTHFTGTTGLLLVGSHTVDDYAFPPPGVGTLSPDNEFWEAFAGPSVNNAVSGI
jgi:hypothetical protein